MTACPHGMPTPGSCVDCMDEGNIPPAPPPTRLAKLGSGFPARHDGHCPGCNLAIHVGQLIVKMSNESYWHTGCAT